jgi:hypothetical protein
METYDKLAAYRAVMERITEQNPGVTPQVWLAEQMQTSRQLVYWWERRGFPDKHADTIGRIVGMDPLEICPNLLLSYIPIDVLQEIKRRTRSKSLGLKLVELIELGLKSL